MSATKPVVAVIGAGIAGLAAADRLARDGFPVVVVEARSRIGGRIDTRHDFAETPIECGAEFVHGRHPELVALIKEASLTMDERRFEPLMLDDGKAIDQPKTWEKVFSELANPDAADVPIASRIGELLEGGEFTEAEARRMRRFVEGYMAADVRRVSARALSEETRAADNLGDDGNASIREGYDAVVRHLARSVEDASGRILLDTPVRRVAWQPGRVSIETSKQEPMEAACAVITIPLSLLQLSGEDGGGITFAPDIAHIRTAARRLAMGNVVKLFLKLRAPLEATVGLDADLAKTLTGARFLQTPSGRIPTWWRTGPDASPILVGWTGGASADRLAGRPHGDVVRDGIETLSHALGVSSDRIASAVASSSVADWSKERWSCGAYSWIPAGALDAPAILSTPVEGTLFFAGEATDTCGYRGTVHGALETGIRAARQIAESM